VQFISNRRKACVASNAQGQAVRALGLISAAVLGVASLSAQAAWDEKYYNPKPLAEDVILPMPCDGFMTLRKVQVPVASPMDDYGVTLGQDSDEWGYIEQARPSYIAGSFTVSKPKPARYYLLAKYEVSELQYQAVMNDSCPSASAKMRLPQVGISWFDATAFADKYSLWLRKNAADKLPKEDGAAGFLRLPTEAEWEFAARGGMAVSQAEFRDLRFPTPDGGLGGYAWFAGAQSANGKLQLTGLLKPNPLGLFDVLGNVDEMLFEPFRLNKLDRQHGQAGGYIVRGGNYLTPQAELRTALRQEQPYYASAGEQTKLKTTGVRLALVAPVLTSRERIKQVEQDWKKLGTPAASQASTSKADSSDPLAEISSIASGVQDDELKKQLEKLRSDLRANTQARDEQRDQAIRSELQLGAFLCTKLKDDGKFLDTLQGNFERSCGANSEEPASRCDARKEQLESHSKVLDFMLNYYADTVVSGALNYSIATIEPQVDVVAQQMAARSKSNLREYLDTHWKNLGAYMKNGKVARSQWLQSCKSI
jgi:formylglycine-generating enzyme required for sulfatase activity